jgi:hypothetical protein
MEIVIRMEGRAKMECVRSEKFTTDSFPEECIGALLQDKKMQMTLKILLPYLTGAPTLT